MNKVAMKGKEFVLEGSLPAQNEKIKDFVLVSNDLTPRTTKDYVGKALVILTVPSLDTGVCDTEVRKFNKEAASLSEDIKILAVSRDLPFAQSRWCGAAGVSRVETLSDYMNGDFGKNFGVMIKDLGLLARAVFVYDKNGVLIYRELVNEVTDEPDYAKALEAAKKAL